MPKGGFIAITALNEEYSPGATRALLDVLGFDRLIETLPFAPNLAFVTK